MTFSDSVNIYKSNCKRKYLYQTQVTWVIWTRFNVSSRESNWTTIHVTLFFVLFVSIYLSFTFSNLFRRNDYLVLQLTRWNESGQRASASRPLPWFLSAYFFSHDIRIRVINLQRALGSGIHGQNNSNNRESYSIVSKPEVVWYRFLIKKTFCCFYGMFLDMWMVWPFLKLLNTRIGLIR